MRNVRLALSGRDLAQRAGDIGDNCMIKLESGRYTIDGKAFYIYSGEIHYFRIDSKLWQKHLNAAKDAGLNTVSSYIPWSLHEYAQGKFDFEGKTNPHLNLIKFIELVKNSGLKFIARIGPVSNAELVNEGVPDWVLKNYPEVFVRGKEITNLPHVTLLAYLNSTFQKLVGSWYDEVVPIIEHNQHPSGPIILVQLCNEIGMVHWLNKAADYSDDTENLYRQFLLEKYPKISVLNSAYNTKHSDFSEIKQPADGSDTQNRVMLWDWMNFYQRYYAQYFHKLHTLLRAGKVHLPVLANIPQFYDFDVRGRGVFSPMTTMMFRDFKDYVPEVIFGGAYQMRRLDYENFHDISITSEVVKMITTKGIPSVCAELQTGIMRDRPKLYAQDVELNLKTSTAHGLNAVNCYMFSGGKNELSFGAFGTYHGWQAPVNKEGKKQEHFGALQEFGDIIKLFGTQIGNTQKHYDTTIGFYAPYYTTEYLSGEYIELLEWKKMQLFYDGLGRLLQVANINYNFVDLQKATLKELLKKPSLVVFSLEFMDEQTQQKLADYVQAGGKLMLNPAMLEYDLAFKKCSVLSDALGVEVEKKTVKHLLFFIGKEDYLAQGELSTFELNKNAKSIVTYSDSKPCGALVKYGKGEALVLGFGLNHMFDYHIDLVKKFADLVGIKPYVDCTEKEIAVVLRENEQFGFLFVANFHDAIKTTKLSLVLPGEKAKTTFPKKGVIKLHNRTSLVLPLNVTLSNGDIIRYSSAQVLKFSESKKERKFTVNGAKGSICEMELITKAKKVLVNGKKITVSSKKNGIVFDFELSGGKDNIVVS